jgi:hypothetical protein
LLVPPDECETLLNAGGRSKRIFWRVEHIVDHPVDGGSCDVDASIGRCVVNEQIAVGARNGSVAERYVGDVADTLAADGCQQISARSPQDPLWLVTFAQEGI